jgi:hypothetical protein
MTFFRLFKSKRNGEKLSYDGYTYNKRHLFGIFTVWRCVKRTCFGSGRSKNEDFEVLNNITTIVVILKLKLLQ